MSDGDETSEGGKVIVVDGANVAYEECDDDGHPKVHNILAVRRLLKERGYDPVVIVDASLKYKVDDEQRFESLIEEQIIRQVPAKTDADYFVLKTAEQHEAMIISNDQYKDYLPEFPWINERRVPLMIIKGEVELYEKQLEEEP